MHRVIVSAENERVAVTEECCARERIILRELAGDTRECIRPRIEHLGEPAASRYEDSIIAKPERGVTELVACRRHG